MSPAGTFQSHFWCLLGLLGYLGSGLGVTFGTGGRFFLILFKKFASADSLAFSSGSAVFAGPGSQVAGIGAQKSYRRAALATFGRLGDGRVEFELLCRSYGNRRD